jgi:hypothetical protein
MNINYAFLCFMLARLQDSFVQTGSTGPSHYQNRAIKASQNEQIYTMKRFANQAKKVIDKAAKTLDPRPASSAPSTSKLSWKIDDTTASENAVYY